VKAVVTGVDTYALGRRGRERAVRRPRRRDHGVAGRVRPCPGRALEARRRRLDDRRLPDRRTRRSTRSRRERLQLLAAHLDGPGEDQGAARGGHRPRLGPVGEELGYPSKQADLDALAAKNDFTWPEGVTTVKDKQAALRRSRRLPRVLTPGRPVAYAISQQSRRAPGALARLVGHLEPSNGDIAGFLDDTAAEIDALLEARGLTPPAAGTAAATALRGLNASAALVIALEATYPDSSGLASASALIGELRADVTTWSRELLDGTHPAIALLVVGVVGAARVELLGGGGRRRSGWSTRDRATRIRSRRPARSGAGSGSSASAAEPRPWRPRPRSSSTPTPPATPATSSSTSRTSRRVGSRPAGRRGRARVRVRGRGARTCRRARAAAPPGRRRSTRVGADAGPAEPSARRGQQRASTPSRSTRRRSVGRTPSSTTLAREAGISFPEDVKTVDEKVAFLDEAARRVTTDGHRSIASDDREARLDAGRRLRAAAARGVAALRAARDFGSTPYRVATEKLYCPHRRRAEAEPVAQVDRSDEQRSIAGAVPKLIESFAPSGSISSTLLRRTT
jgi:hypothetical protein